MEVGEYTYGSELIRLHRYGPHDGPYEWSNSKLKIGKFCSIAPCNIFLNENHRYDWVTTFPFGITNLSKKRFKNVDKVLINSGALSKGNGDIIVGNDVWIGYNASIMSGVNIGHGAVIAGFAHVVKDVEPYSIVGGNPAKHLKYRFSEEQIEKLLEIQWWDWPIEKIDNHLPVLMNENIDEFIKKALEK